MVVGSSGNCHCEAGEAHVKKESNGRKSRGKDHVYPCTPTSVDTYKKV